MTDRTSNTGPAARECGVLGLCILELGHEGLHQTTVDLALANEPPSSVAVREAAERVAAFVRLRDRGLPRDDVIYTIVGLDETVELLESDLRLLALRAAAPSDGAGGLDVASPDRRSVNQHTYRDGRRSMDEERHR